MVCLQEVDRKVFDADLNPVMAEHGFEGAMDLKGGQVSEGVACFFRKARFRLRRRRRFVLSEELQGDAMFAEVRDNFCHQGAVQLWGEVTSPPGGGVNLFRVKKLCIVWVLFKLTRGGEIFLILISPHHGVARSPHPEVE